METNKNLKQKVLELLQENTENETVFPAKNYAEFFNVETIQIKRVIKELIEDGYPILSVRRGKLVGYSICLFENDLNDYVKIMEKRVFQYRDLANKLEYKIKKVKDAFYKQYNSDRKILNEEIVF